ncbi:triose-phosphate isomerase [Rothia uropygialis]|uniref:triose-phosphate isomerase n=1 Tax=Kocuria sp. 36 TaxID=1415402 RepID=UPI00313B0C83
MNGMSAGVSSVEPLWVGTSWKMNKTLGQSREWTTALSENLSSNILDGVQPFVVPSFTAISAVVQLLGERSPVLVGAQNAHWEDSGAWTGEVSVLQVKDAGARIVEIGHSERREHFHETTAITCLKVAATIRHGLTPLLCIGEPADIREAGESSAYILGQARGALDGLNEEQLKDVVIAYEPMWAIGDNGRSPTTEELVGPFDALGAEYSGRVKALLYGGSVNLNNAEHLLKVDHVGGLFVGRTAWDIDGYLQLLDIAAAHMRSRAQGA